MFTTVAQVQQKSCIFQYVNMMEQKYYLKGICSVKKGFYHHLLIWNSESKSVLDIIVPPKDPMESQIFSRKIGEFLQGLDVTIIRHE